MNNKKIESGVFPVAGMMCAVCAGTVERTASSIPGIVSADVNLAANTLTLKWNPHTTDPYVVAEALLTEGYDMTVTEDAAAAIEEAAREEKRTYSLIKRHTIIAWILTLPIFAICMLHLHFPGENFLLMVLTLGVMIGCGSRFYVRGWKNLIKGHPSMDTLVAISTVASFLFSLFNTIWAEYWMMRGMSADVYYEGAAMIIAFVLTGKMLESRAKYATGSSLRSLMALQPEDAIRILPDGEYETVRVAMLRKGDLILIRPGERVPVDGIVIAGESSVDESMMTGEAIPNVKKEGSKVFAGTINGNSPLKIKAEAVGSSTELQRIIRTVREAQGSKAPVQRLVDRIAAIFVPAVMGISLLTFIIWILCHGSVDMALLAAVSVLVIACPCALGLATPTAIMVGIGRGAKSGILIRDAEALEIMSHVKILAIDKTGTLTVGRPVVDEARWIDVTDMERRNLLEAILRLEAGSTHPLAKSLEEFARKSLNGITTPIDLTDQESVTGLGLTAKLEGKRVWIGSENLASRFGALTSEITDLINSQSHAGSIITLAGIEGRTLLICKIHDPLREDASLTISRLKDKGIETILLTGDRRPTAERIAAMAGISRIYAEALPSDKVRIVNDLQEQLRGKDPKNRGSHRYLIAMAGDGINDSAALAAADVSIAMGGGSDIAIDASQLTVVGGRLNAIPQAIALSRITTRIIHENLFWAFIYNVIGIPIAAGILYPAFGLLLSPMIASAAMAFSSVCVVLNSMRLNRIKLK